MFKRGDTVKIKTLDEILEIEDVWNIDEVESPGIVSDMIAYLGRDGIVTHNCQDMGFVRVVVQESLWDFKPEWLEKSNDILTIKDFTKRVEELGFEVVEEVDKIVIRTKDEQMVVFISLENRGCIDTHWNGFKDIDDWCVKYELLDLSVRLATTPIDERGVKYYLSLPEPLKHNLSYLYQKVDTGVYGFADKEELAGYKTKFTQDEIDDFPNQEFIKTLVKEEVKE